MRVLCVGDVTGSIGCEFLTKHLRSLKKIKGIDLCIVNGENSHDANGITPQSAGSIQNAGADIITTGNHVYKRREAYDFLEEAPFVIRPLNFPDENPGKGYAVWDMGKVRVLIANFIGVAFMDWAKNPFREAKKLLEETKEGNYIYIFDFHAEATSEKLAFAYFLDGKVSALFGTHTHVPTADERILKNGTGYVTDIGMTGPFESVLGLTVESAISKFLTGMPGRYEVARGECVLSGVIFDIDEESKKCRGIERISLRA